MQLLNKEESWSLLREGVFGEELCPRELEKPGKLIAENCDGLPLMIVTVANLLSKAAEKTPEYWNKVVKHKNPVFELAYLKISKILYPSYKNLDLELRALFLYIATSKVKCTIEPFNLFMLSTVEGIIPSQSWHFGNFSTYIDHLQRARSLLCFGPPHPYQVPICLESKFLKTLDATRIRFYEFPVGIFKLVLLRYLAITYMGKVPAEISTLWNLEAMRIFQLMRIRYPGDLSYLPVEIWEMKELKYLQVKGSNLPDPPPNSSAILDRLFALVDVRAESVTKSILERMPNLIVLVILVELAPDHASEPLFSFDQLSHLKRLGTIRCIIANPELKPDVVVAAPTPLSMLPSSLKMLYLGGFGYPWEHITPLALLPNLVELELYCYAFQGAEWVMQEGDFKRLGDLILEDTDLVNWRADDSCHLPSLGKLYITHAYKLKEIPWQSIPSSCKTMLVDCNPLALEKMPQNDCQITCSWLEK